MTVFPFTVAGAVGTVKVLAVVRVTAAIGALVAGVVVGPLLVVPQLLTVPTSTGARTMSQACFGTLLIRVPQSKQGARLVSSSPQACARKRCAPATDTTM